jgi:hypothetical protein
MPGWEAMMVMVIVPENSLSGREGRYMLPSREKYTISFLSPLFYSYMEH